MCLSNPVVARVLMIPTKQKSNNRENQEYWDKVKIADSNTYKWEKRIGDYEAVEEIVKHMETKDIKKEIFLYKQIWFRMQIDKIKISWEQGAELLQVDAKRVIQTSLQNNQIFTLNLRKELKIKFQGEEVYDAGGLLREYMVLLIAEIFDSKNELFELTDTYEHYYKISTKLKTTQVDEDKLLIFRLFGMMLAKAILEKIPISPHLDYTLLTHILQRRTTIEDLAQFDEGLFNQLMYVKVEDMSSSCAQELNFAVTFPVASDELFDEIESFQIRSRSKMLNIRNIPLKEDGYNIPVTNENKEEYIQSMIDFHTYKSVQPYLMAFLQEIHALIPYQLFQIFQPEELEIIICGLPFIDVQDWKNNTIYKGVYSQTHQVIQWFWKAVEQFSSDELQSLLQFSTGCSRTPLEGFSKLESNRNIVSPFCIESVEYRLDQQYPKAHTCFNRLELPIYYSYALLEQNLKAILNQQMLGVYGKD